MFFKKVITAVKCDRCLAEIPPSFPQFPINDKGEHFCLDCGFIKGLCTEEEFLDDVGGGLTKRAGFNANIIDGKVIIWSGIAPWETFAKYKELRFEISNGITLCESCHIDAHKKMREAEKGNDRR